MTTSFVTPRSAQLAGNGGLVVTVELHRRALERRLGIGRDVEEILAAEVLVALAMVRVEARRVDLDLDG